MSAWLESAQLVVRQRMRLIAEFSELQAFSASRVFRPRERLDAVGVIHQLADAASGRGRGGVQGARDLHLQGDVGHATVLCEMVSKVVLCPLGNAVCEETTNVVVEPGYHYTFSIYSYPMVSVSTMDVDAVPEFSVSVVPGDYFIQLTVGGAKYPLWGSCLLVAQSGGSDAQSLVEVTLPAETEVSVVASDLVVDSQYVVTCNLYDVRVNVSVSAHRVRVIPAELVLAYVRVSATVNKPATLYCMVRVASMQELNLWGVAHEVEVDLQYLVLNAQYASGYRVTCAAVDLFSRGEVQSLVIPPSGTPFAPEVIGTVPEVNAVEVRVGGDAADLRLPGARERLFHPVQQEGLGLGESVPGGVLGEREPHRVGDLGLESLTYELKAWTWRRACRWRRRATCW